jgi:hypothetical protein
MSTRWSSLYHEDAVNHQVAESPVEGRPAIREMLSREFAAADMTCTPEVIHEAGDVAILEWRDPLGLRGCGFFTVRNGRIAFQRGCWDKLSFLRLNGLPIPSRVTTLPAGATPAAGSGSGSWPSHIAGLQWRANRDLGVSSDLQTDRSVY